MKKILILFVVGALFSTGCSKDTTTEKEDQIKKEALLDLKIKESTEIFEK